MSDTPPGPGDTSTARASLDALAARLAALPGPASAPLAAALVELAEALAHVEARTARIEAAIGAVERALTGPAAAAGKAAGEAAPEQSAVVDGLATLLGTAFADLVADVDQRIAHALATISEVAGGAGAVLPPLDAPLPAADAPTAEAVSDKPAPARVERPAPPLATAPLVDCVFDGDWAGWEARGGLTLPRPGHIEATVPSERPAELAGPPVPLPGGGLVRVVVTAVLPAGPRAWQSRLRLVGDDGLPLGAEVPLADGKTEAFFFAPARTQTLTATIRTRDPVAGQGYAIRRVTIERVHPESYFEHVRARAAAPTIATLASTPAGRDSLPDAVASLLLSCDRVRVYLESYPDIPPCLQHPRVDYRRAQDWDARGDAGHFAWADQVDPPGYRIVASDGLLYPPDFAATLARTLAVYGDRAIVGLGGTLLRQQAPAGGNAKECVVLAPDAALGEDRTVHLLDPAAIAYRTGAVVLGPRDFAYRGLAALWIALYTQRHRVPLIAMARPAAWVRRHPLAAGATPKPPLAAAAVSAATRRRMYPVTLQPSGRPKVAVVIAVTKPHDLYGFLSDWHAARSAATDWVVVPAAARDEAAGVRSVLDTLDLFHEVHLALETAERGPLAEAAVLVGRLGCDAVLVTSDQVRFKSRGALDGLVEMLRREPAAVLAVPTPPAAGDPPASPLLVAFSRDAAATMPAGGGDLPPFCAFAAWAAHAAAGGRLLGQATGDALLHALAMPVLPNEPGASRPAAPEPPTPAIVHRAAPGGINAVFERVVVLNLDRRPERWRAAEARLARAGIRAERFRAVDPAWPETLEDYVAYAASRPVAPPPTLRIIASPRAFYRDYDSQTSRIGHLEQRDGVKAIGSLAAWAALQSHIRVIERAMADCVDSLLVLRDDVVFHRDGAGIFAAAARDLPDDWLILQLGTLHDRWSPEWATWRTQHLYSAGGAAIGAFAVGLRFDAYANLLDHAHRRALPFDFGALSAVTRDFAERCFVISPHIAAVEAEDDAEASAPGRAVLAGYDVEAGRAEPGDPFAR